MAGPLSEVGRERKGSMSLRSYKMNYDRAVLNSDWYLFIFIYLFRVSMQTSHLGVV